MNEENIKEQAEKIVEAVKGFVSDKTSALITLKRKGKTLFSVSTGAGLIGAAIGLKAAPFAMLTAALVAFGTDCEIEIEKADGTIINLNETRVGAKLKDMKDSVVGKAKDKFGDGFEVSVTVEADDAGTDADEPTERKTETDAAPED